MDNFDNSTTFFKHRNKTRGHKSITNLQDVYKILGNVRYILTGVAIVLCVALVIFIARQKKGNNFFKWKIGDRFTIYTLVNDLLQNMTVIITRIHTEITGSLLTDSECVIYNSLSLEFIISQVLLAVSMAFYSFGLIRLKRYFTLGQCDWKLLSPLLGLPLVFIAVSTIVRGGKPYVSYICGIASKHDRQDDTWYHITISSIILLSIFVIVVFYIYMWIYVHRQVIKNTNTLSQSAVNDRRLAIKLSLFCLVYIVQFGGIGIEALLLVEWEPPRITRYISSITVAVGGLLNGVVYLALKK